MRVHKLVLIAIAAISFSACEARAQPLAICVAAAKDHLELFSMGKKTLESRCKCVQSRRDGQLPTHKVDWDVTGASSPILTLVECSETDIYNFYHQAVFTSAKSRLEKAGKRAESIETFSACVASSAFQETRRVAASENGTPGQLDKVAFGRMYGQCEAAIN